MAPSDAPPQIAPDLAFDHVVVATGDPDGLRALLERDWGLRTRPGNQFEDGVSAHIVPLEPPQYLEIVHLTDPTRVPDAFGDHERAAFSSLACLVGLALRTDALDRVAALVNRSVTGGSGVVGHDGPPPWSYVGDEDAPELPWFIRYSDPPEQRLARFTGTLRDLGYEQPPGRIAWAELTGAIERLTTWTAPAAHLDVRVADGAPAARVGLRIGDRPLVLSSDPDAGPTQE